MGMRDAGAFFWGLQSWRARVGYVLGAAAGRIAPLRPLARRCNGLVYGPYRGSAGVFDLRQGTLDAFTVHPGHERATHAAIRAALPGQGGVMLDVGGYCGSFSIRYQDLFQQFVVFEPFPGNAAAVERNLALSGLQGRTTLVQAAVSDRVGVQELHLSNNDTHSLVASSSGATLEVPLTTIDATLDALGIAPETVRFLKADVEGWELAVLRGAQGLLAAARPVVLVEANTDQDERDLTAFLGGMGYGAPLSLDHRNLLFKPAA